MLKHHSGALVVWGFLDLLTLSQQGPVPLPLQGEACFSLAFQLSLIFPALTTDQTLTGASDVVLLPPDMNLDPHLFHPSPGVPSMLDYTASCGSFLRLVPEPVAWCLASVSPCMSILSLLLTQ